METSGVTLSIGDAAKELVTDMIELITVFSARLYGSRRAEKQEVN
jgi:predicted site-specific integrase-resolvase